MKLPYPPLDNAVLTVNAGSSSIKFSLFEARLPLAPVFWGAIDNIGGAASCFRVHDGGGDFERQFAIPDHVTAVRVLADWLQERITASQLQAIGHRIVFEGSKNGATCEVTPDILDAMFFARSYDSEHLPQEQLLIETLKRAFPDAMHVACFDSHFHDDMPTVASMTTLPRRFHTAGIRRSGFHGISCAYVMRELAGLADGDAARGKLVLAHLGGGCSVTAVSAGRSVDTSMGVTPAGGMLMATRSGDIDPGLAWRLFREHDVSAAEFNHMVHHESGLKGISGTTGNLQQLMEMAATDPAAAEAIAMFCYQAKKHIGAMACALEGLDTLVFAGGIGENSSVARQRICEGLAFLGIDLDPAANVANARIISSKDSKVIVRIVATNEQIIIAEETIKLLSMRESTLRGLAP